MTSVIYTAINGKLNRSIVINFPEEFTANVAFNIEVADEYKTRIIGIRYDTNKPIVPWNSYLAHNCFGKGRIDFEEFVAGCKCVPQVCNN